MNRPIEQIPKFGHAPILMRRVAGLEKLRRPGDFFWEVNDDCSRSMSILVPSAADPGHMLARCGVGECGWQWDGNSDRPTLKTSVLCMQSTSNTWHGYVRDGFLVEA